MSIFKRELLIFSFLPSLALILHLIFYYGGLDKRNELAELTIELDSLQKTREIIIENNFKLNSKYDGGKTSFRLVVLT